MRSKLAAASTPMRDVGGAIEEHVIWRIGDLLRAVAEVVRWPIERIAWKLERRLVWPLQERTAGWGPPPRAAGVGAVAALAIGAVTLGAVLINGANGGEGSLPAAEPVISYAPAPAPAEDQPSGPSLQGVAPQFGVGDGVGVARAGADAKGAKGAAADDSLATTEAGGTSEEAAATTSSKKPVPAGPAAMKVARRFSEAFVFYEIGKRPAQAISVFEQTATPQLATALAERPPRQPASAKVPKARVLNLVPGPRSGRVYTVSASLLRVGVTSELRLKLARQPDGWRITDVRG